MRILACALLALALAGCSSYGSMSYNEAPRPPVAVGYAETPDHLPWIKTCPQKDVCGMELSMRGQNDADFITIYAAYDGPNRALAFSTPADTGTDLAIMADGSQVGRIPLNRCSAEDCRSFWRLTLTDEARLFSAKEIAVRYIRRGQRYGYEFPVPAASLNRAFAQLPRSAK